MCEECQEIATFECPGPWFHQETNCCPDCENIVEIREEHFEECAMRAFCRLALTNSELRPKGVIYTPRASS